jgi:hypothetical protein
MNLSENIGEIINSPNCLLERENIIKMMEVLSHIIVATLCVVLLKKMHPHMLMGFLCCILGFLLYGDSNISVVVMGGVSIYLLRIATQDENTLKGFLKENIWELPYWCIVSNYIISGALIMK